MTERGEGAVVMLMFLEAETEDGTDGTVQATAARWFTMDMGCARTLREQLVGLLGAPSELLLPAIAASAARELQSQWPGSVELDQDD